MKPSGIITLMTDFGTKDPYVAMMKGVILSINPLARIVDISHQLKVGSISQAATLIKETFPFFPSGTVHVVVVDPTVGSKRRLLGLEAGGHFFVGPDNGIFWGVIEGHEGAEIFQLTEERYFLPRVTRTFHGREVFAPVGAHLSSGVALEKMGKVLRDPVRLNLPIPYREKDTYLGQITRVDNFGNLITNIHRAELEEFLESARPVIEAGNLTIKQISNAYTDVDEGAPLALINSSDLLEIAVNLGRADRYVGIDGEEILGTVVKVNKLA